MIGKVGNGQAALGGQVANKQDIKAAAQAFEAVFLRQMISSMRSASLGDDLFGSNASDQFRDMSDARMADSMATSGKGFGIAELLMTQFGAKVADKGAAE